jgi:hypothetical protein
LVNYSGVAADINGKPLSGITGMTFLLYRDEKGGAPLWMETQNVHPDKTGHYSVVLGSTTSQGLPQDVFASGEARWLGVQIVGQDEQPRVLLVAVPYALKAGDAETIGGLPASAFVLANEAKGTAKSASTGTSSSPTSAQNAAPPTNPTVTGKGVVNFIPMWDTTKDIIDSLIFQKAGNVGINTTAPTATLDVNGKSNVRDTLTLFPKGTDSTLAVSGSTFKVDQTGKVNFVSGQTFPGTGTITGVTTASGSGLQGGGTSGTLSLGLVKTCASKQVLQWNGSSWVCASISGTGTVTSVGLSAPSSDFTVSGSPVTSSGTLGLNWNVTPTSAATANAIIKRDSNGSFNATNIGANYATLNDISNGQAILAVSTPPSAITIYSQASATSGTGYGIKGVTSSGDFGAIGVYGYADSPTGLAAGTAGYTASPSGLGVYGQNGSLSSTGLSRLGNSGVAGDAGGTTAGNVGVLGTADNGVAGEFANNSAALYTLNVTNLNSAGYPFIASTAGGSFCQVDNKGNLGCTGAKNALVPLDGGKRKVALSAIESPKNWFEDFGSAQLVGGAAVVSLDPDFMQTVNTEMDYQVFPVPNGDCRGLYVTNKMASSFEVRELGGGNSSVRFDYRITALRRNYENVRFADHTNDPVTRKIIERRSAIPSNASPLEKRPPRLKTMSEMSAATE